MIIATYIDADTFTVGGDQTSIFHEGRRIRCYCGVDGYKYGTITSSSYSSPNTTVNLTATSDNLTSNLESVKYGIIGKGGDESLPVHDHDEDEGEGGTIIHSELTNLAYADSGHTGFAPTSHSHTESDISDLDKYTEAEVNTISGALNTKISGKADTGHTHDDRYYTESEVDTISGSLNTKIEAKPDTLLELTDTPAAYEEGKYLKSSAGAIEFVTPEGIALVAEVKEENISAITKGQMCAITGSSGAKFEVGLCDCDDATKIRVIGLAQTNIAQNEEGVVVYKGELLNVDSRTTNTDVNPNAEEWNAGELLYVSQTPGGLTKVRPTSGRCIKAGRTQKGNSASDTFLAIVDVNSICACAAAGEDLCHRMGDVAGVNKVSYRSYDNNEVAAFDSYGNLTLSGTVDGRDVATDGSKLDGIATGADVTGDNPPQAHTHDDRYYTESEVDTISGTLSSEINSDITTHTNNSDAHHNESHTIVSHSDTTATGANLNELVGSGDTTLHKHDDRYYTESEVDTISGSLNTKIDGKDNYSSWNFAVDGSTKDAITSGDVLDFVGGDNITIIRSAEDQITISGSAGGGGGGLSWEVINIDTTAVNGSGYLINASSENITLTLPSTPSEGDIIGACDIYEQATASGITIARNGSNIEGAAEDLIIDVDGSGFTLVYADATRGWEIVSEIGGSENSISDTAYGVGWDGVTDTAPSKNAVYDEIELRAPKASPTFTGQVTIPTINLTGGQIAFPATAVPSAGPNTLDDYEEGTFTVTITCDTGTITVNTDYDTMAYTKIGRSVFINGEIAISSVSSPVGAVLISSLPFTVADLAETSTNAAFSVFMKALSVSRDILQCRVIEGLARLQLEGWSGTSSVDMANHVGAGDIFIFGGNYIAA